jgi:hypothetical protein
LTSPLAVLVQFEQRDTSCSKECGKSQDWILTKE